MEAIKITLNKKTYRISQKFEKDELVNLLLDNARLLAEFNNSSVEEELAELAVVRQVHNKQNTFEPEEDGTVYARDYLSYFDNELGFVINVYFDENVYHSSLAKAAKTLNADLTQFFSKLEESYKQII